MKPFPRGVLFFRVPINMFRIDKECMILRISFYTWKAFRSEGYVITNDAS
jgi:hypothetical protein